VAALIPDYRTAGVLLLLTALATAISVPARLAAGADDTPFTDALAQRLDLDAVQIARMAVSEKLSAIGSAKAAYGTGGAARLIGGLTLLAASLPLWHLMRAYHPRAMGAAAVLFAASGIASAVSGASAIALTFIAPEPQSTAVLTDGGGLGNSAGNALLIVRWVTGTLGFTLAGLALAALAPVQWRMGGLLQAAAVVEAVLGIAMLFIWLDAATVVHRITGIAFLLWLIAVGLWLVTGRIETGQRASRVA
jgi:hypothetical protein